jgi:VIT1/CCC1 family predicted Fe2+/Mn2+ transporter
MVQYKHGGEFDPPDKTGQAEDVSRSGVAGWVPEYILSGLALILPALAFTVAALVFYPPAATAMAPVALGLIFVGLGLVLMGIVSGRRA